MNTHPIASCASLAVGLLLLAACITPKVLHEWRNPDVGNARFGHFMVVAFSKQDETRRLIEDEFAWQISNQGQMVTRSYNIVPTLNEYTAGRIATLANAFRADGILVIRRIAGEAGAPSEADRPSGSDQNVSEFLRAGWKDAYDPPAPMTNAKMIVDVRLYVVSSGTLIWSLVAECNKSIDLKREIQALAEGVLAHLKDALRAR